MKKTVMMELIEDLNEFKNRFDKDPTVERFIGIAINQAKSKLKKEEEQIINAVNDSYLFVNKIDWDENLLISRGQQYFNQNYASE